MPKTRVCPWFRPITLANRAITSTDDADADPFGRASRFGSDRRCALRQRHFAPFVGVASQANRHQRSIDARCKPLNPESHHVQKP
jgi:hypothetical protein